MNDGVRLMAYLCLGSVAVELGRLREEVEEMLERGNRSSLFTHPRNLYLSHGTYDICMLQRAPVAWEWPTDERTACAASAHLQAKV